MMKPENLTIDELISLALVEKDEDARWEYVSQLHGRAEREVFEAAKSLCRSANPEKMTLGADILGQLGAGALPFKNESVPLLLELADSSLQNSSREDEINALQAVVIALGKMATSETLRHISGFKKHPSSEVREAAAYGLAAISEEDFVLEALLELTADADEDVRNWATFGLAQKNADTEEIREALYRRLSDSGTETADEIRGEALVGLALRKDERVVPPLLQELSGETVGVLAVEAAAEMADERFCGVLRRLKSWWDVDEELLDEALKNCCSKNGKNLHAELSRNDL